VTSSQFRQPSSKAVTGWEAAPAARTGPISGLHLGYIPGIITDWIIVLVFSAFCELLGVPRAANFHQD